MTKHMLIDATHAEETRVVVMNNKHVDDYDVETLARRQLKGNIYLAKIIRVEPSLQAAFVDYGGNRHGFLAFSEIHPDYFQIPIADREKLLALQEEEYALEHRDQDNDENISPDHHNDDSDDNDLHPEIVSGEHDTGDEQTASRRTARFLRNYRIQEVIRRRQIILVQIVKEERGNKGAALSTYISLAGRYGVLMPNALRGGGVSRKITSDTDRKRLRDIVSRLTLPRSMAMIIRTAGAGQPEPEIIRDCDYLLQLWDDIRSHALESAAPTLVYEEASLIKRAIRDLFTSDIETVYVDGENAWKNAREFTRLLMPNNANRIRHWQNRGQSLFSHYNVESHLDAMFSPTVRLESGGYLVINQTEALVAIDVNSGKSTSQRNIEDTAIRTNLEAAEEVARQLRLRDLAGLIVIDFIDMESRRHNNQVEKRLKESLRLDRARIQVGRISHFGLLEMSRQRLRPSLAESMLSPCPHCKGTGSVRGIDSTALHVLRSIEEVAGHQRASHITVYVASGIILYMLNSKRLSLAAIEQRHSIKVTFEVDDTLDGDDVRIDQVQLRSNQKNTSTPRPHKSDNVKTINITEGEAPTVTDDVSTHSPTVEDSFENTNRRRNRNRNRGRHSNNEKILDTISSDHETDKTSDRSYTQEKEYTEHDLMPGRRRTRVRRVNSQQTNESPRKEPEKQTTQNKKPSQNDETYHGPTPANPFQGFDIFDVIEQGEMSHSQSVTRNPTQPHANTKSELEEVPSPQRRTRRKRPSRNKKSNLTETEIPSSSDTKDTLPSDDTHISVETSSTYTEEVSTPKTSRRPKRTRKTTPISKPVDNAVSTASSSTLKTHEEEETKPTRKRRTTRRKKTEITDIEKPSKEEIITPQPVNIDDDVKPTKRRVGWWKR